MGRSAKAETIRQLRGPARAGSRSAPALLRGPLDTWSSHPPCIRKVPGADRHENREGSSNLLPDRPAVSLPIHRTNCIHEAFGGHGIAIAGDIHVAHDVAAARDRPGLELLRLRIEAHDRVGLRPGFVVPEGALPPSPRTSMPSGSAPVRFPSGCSGLHRNSTCLPPDGVVWMRVAMLPYFLSSPSQTEAVRLAFFLGHIGIDYPQARRCPHRHANHGEWRSVPPPPDLFGVGSGLLAP